MKKQAVLRASAFVIVLTLCVFSGSAYAANVTVGCTGGSGTYPTIAAALTAIGQIGPSTITVTGTCNENVPLSNARSLTFIAGTGGAKIFPPTGKDVFDISVSQNIILQNLEIYGSTGFGVLITEDSDVHINSCNIHNNAGGGVYAQRNSTLFLLNTTIQDNTPGDGLDVAANSLATTDGNTTIEDNGCPGGGGLTPCAGTLAGGIGVFVGFNSTGSFGGNMLIQNNQDTGILARDGGMVYFRSASNQLITVKGHNLYGVVVTEGSHLLGSGPSFIEGNGAKCAPNAACGGIVDGRNSTINMGDGTISGNPGPGIFEQFGAHARLNNVTVSNNSGDGLHLQWISTLDYGSGNTVTGNGGASVSCDVESLVVGDLSGLSHVKCPKVEEPSHEVEEPSH